MMVHVKLFAAAKELAGTDELAIGVSSGATIADVRRALVAAAPKLERIVSHALFAINAEYASDSAIVPENSDVALIPPVSGG